MKLTATVSPVLVGKFWEADVTLFVDGVEGKRYTTDEGAKSPEEAVAYGWDDVNDYILYYKDWLV